DCNSASTSSIHFCESHTKMLSQVSKEHFPVCKRPRLGRSPVSKPAGLLSAQKQSETVSIECRDKTVKGEAFKDKTVKDWKEVWDSPTGRRLDQEHRKEVREHKAKCMEYLQVIAAIQESLVKLPGQSVTSPTMLI
ncbi:hypothetical protein CesoFtcFv8_020163, partial [Champsocephalus esox]